VSDGPAAETKSLWVLLAVVIVFVALTGTLLKIAVSDACEDQLQAGLAGVASTGGIVSGLSLSATSVLTLSGRYRSVVLAAYGPAIRFVIFGGFSLVVLAAFACAIAPVWIAQEWVRYVLAFAVPIMVSVTLATALLVNRAFGYDRDQRSEQPAPDGPYGL
jgi:hypothetical protein